MKEEKNKIDKRWDGKYPEWFSSISGLDIDTLLRSNAQEYNFNEVRPQVTTITSVSNELAKNYDFWNSLPQRHKRDITTTVEKVLGVLDEISSFNPQQDNAWSRRAQLVQRLDSEYRELYELLVEKLYAYLGNKAYSSELKEEFGTRAKLELDEIRKIRGDIDKIREDVREASTIASDTASTATAHFFDEEAKDHEEAAGKWFYGVIASLAVVGFVTLLFALSIIEDLSGQLSNVDATYVTIKIVIVAVSLLALRFTTKNYNANKHLASVNKHRANVLKSIEAHRTTAVDTVTKDAVLAAGVAAAFSQAETGFISTREGAGSETNDPVSYLRDIVPRGDK